MLESSYFENISLFLISIYSIFIVFWLTVADLISIDELILSRIDTVFLTLFIIEIFMKSFASNLNYLKDIFNLFDAIIVVISFSLNLLGIIAKGLGVLRLIRVVVITIRKITGNQSKLRHQSKNINPVESVISILQQICELNEISFSIKKEARWCIEIIETNKLYDLNFDLTSEEKNFDMEAKAWLNVSSKLSNIPDRDNKCK